MSIEIRRLRLVSILVLLVVAALAVGPSAQAGLPPAQESEPQANAQVATITNTEDPALGLQMWTAEARATAQPLPWREASPGELTVNQMQDVQTEGVETAGRPGLVPGSPPDAQAEAAARTQFPEAWADLELEEELELEVVDSDEGADPFGAAGVFTRYKGNQYHFQWKNYPYNAVGKLYIDNVGYCTASVINPSLIVTAAHCVFDTDLNLWYTGWTFVPAERKNAPYYGTFRWASATVLTNWIDAPDYGSGRRYDVALISLNNNTAGFPVEYYTGTLGYSWDWGYIQHHHSFGYASNLTTKFTSICASESFQESTDLLGTGCDMTYGSSGGPWMRKFWPRRVGAYNYVNSVVSGGQSSTCCTTFYGARFSSNNIVILCSAMGLC
jgi:V8-like Glu-specific endopeptidase